MRHRNASTGEFELVIRNKWIVVPILAVLLGVGVWHVWFMVWTSYAPYSGIVVETYYWGDDTLSYMKVKQDDGSVVSRPLPPELRGSIRVGTRVWKDSGFTAPIHWDGEEKWREMQRLAEEYRKTWDQ